MFRIVAAVALSATLSCVPVGRQSGLWGLPGAPEQARVSAELGRPATLPPSYELRDLGELLRQLSNLEVNPGVIPLPGPDGELKHVRLEPIWTCAQPEVQRRVIGLRTPERFGFPGSMFVTRTLDGFQILAARDGIAYRGNLATVGGRLFLQYAILGREQSDQPSRSPDELCSLGVGPSVRVLDLADAISVKTPVHVTQDRELRLAVIGTQNLASLATKGEPARVPKSIDALIVQTAALFERDASVRLCLFDIPNRVLDQTTSDLVTAGGHTARWASIQKEIDQRAKQVEHTYDLGHLLTVDVSSAAKIGSACTAENANAFTSLLTIDDVGTFAHELGHQLGAGHSFNGDYVAQWHQESAVEPGSGTTLMSYAGHWELRPERLASQRDMYFHGGSVAQMTGLLASRPSCGTRGATTQAPIIELPTGNTLTIPPESSFRMTATARDPEGTPVRVRWEEMDPGVKIAVGPPDFRSFDEDSTVREFPRMLSVAMPGTREAHPTAHRSYLVRVIARDRDGGMSNRDVTVAVEGTELKIVEPAAGDLWRTSAGKAPVRWKPWLSSNGTPTSIDLRIVAFVGHEPPRVLGEFSNALGAADVDIPNVRSESPVVLRLSGADSFFVETVFRIAP